MELYIENIVRQYFSSEEWKVNLGSSGMNNTTRFLSVNDENVDTKQYVLRVYESHRDKDKVLFEHEVLQELGKKELSFSIPRVEKTLDKKTIATTQDGKLISLVAYIEGSNPRLDSQKQYYNFGKVAGEITRALGQIKTIRKPAYSTYYDLEASYPECPLNKVIDFCQNPPLGFDKDKLSRLSEYFISFQKNIPLLEQLPHQLSHGDINASNVLEDDKGNICAVLDFEFVTWDLRVMDLAVCLSEVVNPENDQEMVFKTMRSLIKGYLEYVKLSKEEIEAIPDLLILRRLDVFVHFLVRYKEGISNNYMSAEQILKDELNKTIIIGNWVSKNREYIKDLIV